ncbi:MAG: amidotransferase [Stygiobacter sp. RIFOXYA12_FULL_38_9]|nr:MAG: amidotransferase [Stygiobacter sp. GWC2_38_9]OGU83946.1 MAG: amidotransferase [Stygiobacter sp. RIFOXYA12_FULL_38_9]OGV09307.1 MAG: amidotransferase [Stygiobacter sp. RIFOXYB2_FULL_37_11]OGV11741.1 MAG: amidotransferase [Stygiobacter sp. RIFOXYA2_FULL_38_8]OGV16554.1 MAG: amidotransferase [Stygiobacter sp. RIFOXYC2_FULL_38_25]OGV79864.1 MAG: amidotransferase [Stygiobacter sp. GWF2_38_21]RJQ60890.1 MAG: type 1 glutamine amidotransferase [Stygiobacter sp.]
MKSLHIHYFQHVTFEGLGCIEEWALQNGHSLSATKFYESPLLPDLQSIDWLIVMGGPMSINDEAKYPWLKPEKEFIKKAINENKVVIGICLGAQLIADVLGEDVYPNEYKEIGWFPIQLTEQGKQSFIFSGSAETSIVFCWHGDTFDLPQNSKLLFYNECCKNQAFVYKEKVLGLQFHLEVTKLSVEQLMKHGEKELIKGEYIQTSNQIQAGIQNIANCNKMMFKILNRLTEL